MARNVQPEKRKLTVREKRNKRLELVTMTIVVGFTVIAAIISFVALRWVGEYMNMGDLAALLPLAIDGFGVICALGIVRSQSMKEPLRQRASEWGGLTYALVVSVAGNIVHALNPITGAVPPIWLVIGFVSAIPVIVAYGIHLLGRAIDNSVSAHMIDGEDEITFDLRQIGDEKAAPAPRAPRPAAPRPTAATAVAEARATASRPTAHAAAPKAVTPDDEVFEQYAESVRTGKQWTGKQVGDALGFSEGAGRKIRARWDKRLDELNAIVPPTDRGAVDLDAARSTPERASA